MGQGISTEDQRKQSTRTEIKRLSAQENVLSMFIVFHSLHALEWAATWSSWRCHRVRHADSVRHIAACCRPPAACSWWGQVDLNWTVDNPLTTAVNRQRLLGNKSITTSPVQASSVQSAPGAGCSDKRLTQHNKFPPRPILPISGERAADPA